MCIYWLPNMHKITSNARFIITGKKCIDKQLSKHVISAFKLCYSQIDGYHEKCKAVHHGHLRKEGISSFLLNHCLRKQ